MLQKLRDQTQGTGFKVLVAAIIVVLTLFGFGATNLFMGGDPELAEVGDYEITQNVLAAETERERRRVLAQMGPEFDPSSIDRLQLQQYVLQQLISRQVMYQTVDNMGVSVPPEVVNHELVNSPAYQVDGQFNEAIYRQQVQALGYTPVSFVEEFTRALSAQQLRSAVSDSALLTDWELGAMVRVINQQRDLAYLPLTVEQFRDQIEVSDDEVALRYNEDQSAYMTELQVDAAYIDLSAADLAADEAIEVSDDELQALYADDRAAALADEKRDSSHILIQVNDDRSAEQALQLITEIQTRLSSGENFADLAAEFSEDPGSAERGGELGVVGKGIFDPAFEQALWALQEPGDVSPPVLSSFGYHLIKLNGIVVPDYPAFEDQRESLVQRARQLKAEDLFTQRVLELERAAYDERFSLDATAESLGLELHHVARVGRKDRGDDPVIARDEVVNALFTNEVLEGTNSEAVVLGDSEVVIVRVDEQYAPEPIPLTDVADDIREALVRDKALVKIDEARNSGLARLHAGESVAEIAASLGSSWKSYTLAGRGGAEDIPPAVRTVAFDLPRPGDGAKSVGVANLPDGAALVTVTRVVQGDLNTTTDAETAELRRLTQGRVARFDFQSLFNAAEEALGVIRPAG